MLINTASFMIKISFDLTSETDFRMIGQGMNFVCTKLNRARKTVNNSIITLRNDAYKPNVNDI